MSPTTMRCSPPLPKLSTFLVAQIMPLSPLNKYLVNTIKVTNLRQYHWCESRLRGAPSSQQPSTHDPRNRKWCGWATWAICWTLSSNLVWPGRCTAARAGEMPGTTDPTTSGSAGKLRARSSAWVAKLHGTKSTGWQGRPSRIKRRPVVSDAPQPLTPVTPCKRFPNYLSIYPSSYSKHI